MIKVFGVRFKKGGKIYYFDPLEYEVPEKKFVVVETAKGEELGECVLTNRLMDEDRITPPLKPIIRMATDEDIRKKVQYIEKEKAAAKIFLEKVKKHNLGMSLVETEYAFSGSKLTFYFTAEGRVDFRELVKDLVREFKLRIELRQIGVRDETKTLKGLAPCGRGVCCGHWLTDFTPVSIKMAKDQNLSLHPVKISGLCNRLMCCLSYEHSTYVQISEGMPEVFDKVQTPKGTGTVVSTEILKGRVAVRHFVSGNGKMADSVEVFDRSEVVKIASDDEKESHSHADYDKKDRKKEKEK